MVLSFVLWEKLITNKQNKKGPNMQNRQTTHQASSTSSLFSYFNDGVGVNLGHFGKWNLRLSNIPKNLNFSYSTMLSMFSIISTTLVEFTNALPELKPSSELSEQVQFRYDETDYQIQTIPFYKLITDGIQDAINVGMFDNRTISALTNSTKYLNEVFKIGYDNEKGNYFTDAVLNRGLGPIQESPEQSLINFMNERAEHARDEANAKSIHLISIILPSMAACWIIYLATLFGTCAYKQRKAQQQADFQSINTILVNETTSLTRIPHETDIGFEELPIEEPKNWTLFSFFNNLKNPCLNVISKAAETKADYTDRNYSRT